MDEFITK